MVGGGGGNFEGATVPAWIGEAFGGAALGVGGGAGSTAGESLA
jgi:hypothetical protein